MHRDERKALAEKLLGKGREGVGPLRPEWVRERFEISAQSLMKWRKNGIPADRVDDVLSALQELGITKEAAPSMTERLELIEAILRSTALVSGVTPAELEAIEEAHQRALALRRSQQQSGGRNPKGGRHPAGT